jgi:hypothetical protein
MDAIMANFKSTKWGADMAEKWARYLELKELLKDSNPLKTEQDRLKEELVKAFGDEQFARLPDGSYVQRVKKGRDKAASPARREEWYELSKMEQ